MNATQTKRILRDIPTDKSIMLVAKHGVGKSSVVKQVAKELGIGFHDVRLSQCEVGDVKGLPCLNESSQRTEFLKPYWWPRDPQSRGILFFDELNRASKDVLQAVFEICLDRRLDGEALPAGWRVVAAINGSDDYDVVELDPALLDRWFFIDFDPTAKEWMNWATGAGIHPAIVDYIAQNPEHLDPPVGNLEAGKVYPSRRSWCQFHDTVQALGLWDEPDEGFLTQIAKGWLGSTVSITFPKFFMNDFARLKPDDILDNLAEVKHKVEAAAVDIESIAALSRSVTKTIDKRTAASLQEAQQDNIKAFMQMLPKDVASQFWTDLLEISKMKKIILKWQTDKEFSSFIRSVYCR
jgi:AAA domain (dynein-related subfamily)